MKVEMKVNQSGCPEGHTVVHFEKGQQVDLPESLARVFISEGWAKKTSKHQTKNKGAATENKSRRQHGA